MARPQPSALMDRGNLIVKKYWPDNKYTDKAGNTQVEDVALVYTDMGSPEANAEASKHAFRITARSSASRELLRRAAQSVAPADGREVAGQKQNYILPCLLGFKIERNNRPFITEYDENGEPKLDAKGQPVKKDNQYYNKPEPRFYLTRLNRHNPVDNLQFPPQTFATVKNKQGEEIRIARPSAYLRGALIFPAVASPERENGKPYVQERDRSGNPLPNPITGRRLDIVWDKRTLQMFVPDSEIERNPRFQEIFKHVDQTETKRPMVVNFMAPLSFNYRSPLDPETKKEDKSQPRNVLVTNLGVATYIYLVPTEEPKAKEKQGEEMGLVSSPDDYAQMDTPEAGMSF